MYMLVIGCIYFLRVILNYHDALVMSRGAIGFVTDFLCIFIIKLYILVFNQSRIEHANGAALPEAMPTDIL